MKTLSEIRKEYWKDYKSIHLNDKFKIKSKKKKKITTTTYRRENAQK